jgi:hypothetical protein
MRGHQDPKIVWLAILFLAFLISCGSHAKNNSDTPGVSTGPSADFLLGVAPADASLTAGTNQSTSVTASGTNGFSGAVTVTISGLPVGVTATPASLSLTPGAAQMVTFVAAADVATASATVTFFGVSGILNHGATFLLSVVAAPPPPPPTPPPPEPPSPPSPPPPPTTAGVDVTTYHYDNARDGLNANETTLTLSNVKVSSFGKIALFPTDGKVDGEPLYLSQLAINGVAHNVLYAVTEHDSVYAFDADSGTVLWQKSMLGTNETPSDDHGCSQINPEIGITNTPVIDRALGAIFFVAMSKDASGNYHQRLHALNITSGAEIEGGPTEITASYPGTGKFSQNGQQVFDPGQYAERVGLLLMNGNLFLGWTSHCDFDPYTGWLMMYNETTLQRANVLNLTPNGPPTDPHFQGGEGSIWQSGAGLAADAQGNIYFLTANGAFDMTLDANGLPVGRDFGNTFVKVSTANGTLAVTDYFSPDNTEDESVNDLDLGSGGVLLLPDVADATGATRHLAVGAGKDGNIYVVDRDNMGKFSLSMNNIYQEIPEALTSEFGMAAYFNNTVYYGGINDVLRAFTLQAGKLSTTPTSQSVTGFNYPGTTPSISANGTQNGIVWAVESTVNQTAVLHAYDATNLASELYNSLQAPNGRDGFGTGNKFITPMIVNGKVFVGMPNGVAVFGLLQ